MGFDGVEGSGTFELVFVVDEEGRDRLDLEDLFDFADFTEWEVSVLDTWGRGFLEEEFECESFFEDFELELPILKTKER